MNKQTKKNPMSSKAPKNEKKTLMGDGAVKTENRDTGAVAVAPPPAPKVKKSLRGHSTVSSPVNLTWMIADSFFNKARQYGEPTPKRKDVVAACVGQGIAPYTARTQYQLWFRHTNGGTRLMVDGNIPAKMLKEPAAETLGEAMQEIADAE